MVFSYGRWVWLWLALAAGAVIAGFGVRLVWRGATGNVWKDRFGEPFVPPWLYVVAGGVCVAVGGALAVFILWQWHAAAE